MATCLVSFPVLGSFRIGLLKFPRHQVQPAGNTALLGAKLALFDGRQDPGGYVDILARVKHVSLHEDPNFQDAYVEEMTFP